MKFEADHHHRLRDHTKTTELKPASLSLSVWAVQSIVIRTLIYFLTLGSTPPSLIACTGKLRQPVMWTGLPLPSV